MSGRRGAFQIGVDSANQLGEIEYLRRQVLLLKKTSVAPKGVVWYDLTAAEISSFFNSTGRGIVGRTYEGWAICNGNNGTRNITGFIRANQAVAGGTGGSDSSAHTHDINHNHASFNSGSESAHTHDEGSLHARIHGDATHTYYDFLTGNSWTSDYRSAIGVTADVSYTGTEAISVDGVTAAGTAHLHAVDVPALGTTASGAASATDNKPAYTEMVPLMRLATS